MIALLGQRYGLHAIDMVHEKKWGRIAVLKGLDITDITIKEAIATNRRLDQRFFDVIADLEAKVKFRRVSSDVQESHPRR